MERSGIPLSSLTPPLRFPQHIPKQGEGKGFSASASYTVGGKGKRPVTNTKPQPDMPALPILLFPISVGSTAHQSCPRQLRENLQPLHLTPLLFLSTPPWAVKDPSSTLSVCCHLVPTTLHVEPYVWLQFQEPQRLWWTLKCMER